MEIFPPDLQSEIFTAVEEFAVYQRNAAQSEEKSEEKMFLEKKMEDSKKKLKSLKNEIFTRYALRTSPSKTINEQDADFRLRLEVFQKTRELLPLMEVLEAKDSRPEEREKALSRAREICDSLKERVSPKDPPCFDPGPVPDDFVLISENPPWLFEEMSAPDTTDQYQERGTMDISTL